MLRSRSGGSSGQRLRARARGDGSAEGERVQGQRPQFVRAVQQFHLGAFAGRAHGHEQRQQVFGRGVGAARVGLPFKTWLADRGIAV